jgi:hypothetical protein
MIKIHNRLQSLLSYNIKLFRIRHISKAYNPINYTNDLNFHCTAKELSLKSQGDKSIKFQTKYGEVPNLFIQILKKHVKENKYTGHISAMKQYRKETGVELSTNVTRNAIEILVKELGPQCIYIDSHTVKDRESNRSIKIKDRHLQSLKSYLIEDRYIGPAQANRKLRQETGLEVGDKTVSTALNNLRIKMGTDYTNLDLNKLKARRAQELTKLKDVHLEMLNNYLKEDIHIGPSEANKKLHKETGLEISNVSVSNALIKLRKQINIENFDSHTLKEIYSNRLRKLKHHHLECLKKYLIEDKYIGPTEANRKLHSETGLNIDLVTVSKAITMLREEMGAEYANLDLNLLKSKRFNERSKLKDSHLECLKSCLGKDAYISAPQAKRKLHEESGLEVSDDTVRKALVKLKKDMNLDSQFSYKNSFIYTKRKPYTRLKSLHFDLLRKYLKEDKYIGGTAATIKLYEETGIDISNYTVIKVLKKLRDEMGPEYAISNSYMIKSRQYNDNIKLKDFHIEILKSYLKEDKYISPTEANKKLCDKTGIEIKNCTMDSALKNLRKEMGPEYSNLDLSIFRNRKIKNLSKLKDFHLDCLNNYLIDNSSIKASEARDKLCQETGLEMSVSSIVKALAKLRVSN